jgi:hypothetical protein
MMESLTNQLAKEAMELIEEVEEMGGMGKGGFFLIFLSSSLSLVFSEREEGKKKNSRNDEKPH